MSPTIMHESILIAGSGGQGILFAGTVLAQAGLNEGKEVLFFPSYGAEIRGGTANCTVVISDAEIGSPIVEQPSAMIILNAPSFDRFLPRIQHDGLVVVNTSLINDTPKNNGITTVSIAATDIAEKELKNKKIANIVAIGAFIKTKNILSPESIEKALDLLMEKKQHLLEVNKSAFKKGLQG